MSRPVVHLDYETYSEMKFGRSKLAVGSHRYAEHESTEVLCLGYSLNDEPVKLWIPQHDPPQDLFDWIVDGALVRAWNAGFEIAVWQEVCVRRMGWPAVPFRNWRDTAADAMAHALPWKLDDTLKALGLPGKDPRGDRLVRKLCQPRRVSKHNPATRWTPETAPADFFALYEYCKQDVTVEKSVLPELPYDLSPEELWCWRETARMNLRGWAVDMDSVERMIELLGQHREDLLLELREVTGDVVTTENQRDRTLKWLADEHGVELPDYTADTIKDVLEKGDFLGGVELPRGARRVLEIRQTLGKSSVKKYAAIAWKASGDCTIKDGIAYHGATTGRDAGRGVQIQNFIRKSVSDTPEGIETAIRTLQSERPFRTIETLYGDIPNFASLMTRSMLCARPGHELFAVDLKQIENRVVVWMANCPYGIDIFERGLDEYRVFATEFPAYGGVAYDDVTGAQRDHAKQGVLGCVFGMGWAAMIAQAERFGQEMSEDDAKELVNLYRDKYPEVVELWSGLNHAAMRAVRTGKTCEYAGKPRKGIEIPPDRRIRFEMDEKFDFLFMVLPSGRRLAYPQPKVQLCMTPWGQKKPAVTHMGMGKKIRKWERRHVTPGRWAENATQATARDVMMYAIRRGVEAGYAQVGRVHDEGVAERPIGEGDLAEYTSFFTNPPWLRGIPIEADGWVGRRYRKS